MSQIRELDYLMSRSPSESVSSYEDVDAMAQRILEWLATPVGTIADMPSWGHPLNVFKHEPDSDTLQVMAEITIFEKLSTDVVDVDLVAVSVEFPEIDLMKIAIQHGGGFLEEEVSL